VRRYDLDRAADLRVMGIAYRQRIAAAAWKREGKRTRAPWANGFDDVAPFPPLTALTARCYSGSAYRADA
jgi:hypothetical protein